MPPKPNPQQQPRRSFTRSQNKSKIENTDEDKEVWTCQKCKTNFTQDTDRIIQCEYCENCFCSVCLGLTPEQYDVFTNPSLHWFCPTCEDKVMKNIRTDREIETRCAAFLQAMESRVDRLENEIKKKVDSDDVKKIVKETIKETEIVTDQAELAEIKQTFNKQVSELRESGIREKDVIIHQVKECQDKDGTTRKNRYTDYVKSLAAFLEVEDNVVSVTRLGKRPDKTDSMDAKEEPKPRPMKVVWTDIDSKRAFMKSLSRLKHFNENSPHFCISISHDMTKEERENYKKKYLEAKAKNDENTSGKFRYIVRGPPWARRTVRVLKES